MLNQAPRDTQDVEFDEQFFLAFEIQVLQKALPASKRPRASPATEVCAAAWS